MSRGRDALTDARLLEQRVGHLRDQKVEAEAFDLDVELAAELTKGQTVDALLEHLKRGEGWG